jgi:hypothetical protein
MLSPLDETFRHQSAPPFDHGGTSPLIPTGSLPRRGLA